MSMLADRSPYVESAKVIISETEVAIHVEGNWPNPAWELEIIEKEVNDGILHLWLVGKSKPGMAIQVLHPFKYTITIDKEMLDMVHQRKIVVYSRDSNKHVLDI